MTTAGPDPAPRPGAGDLLRSAMNDVRGSARLGWTLLSALVPPADGRGGRGRRTGGATSGRVGRQVTVFAVVGVLSTVAYAVLYLVLRSWCSPTWANALALFSTAVANTAANRRFTFGVVGRGDVWRHHARGLAIFGAGLAVTSGSLVLLHAWSPAPPRWVEISVLTAANLAVTVMRFLLMRLWVFVRR